MLMCFLFVCLMKKQSSNRPNTNQESMAEEDKIWQIFTFEHIFDCVVLIPQIHVHVWFKAEKINWALYYWVSAEEAPKP